MRCLAAMPWISFSGTERVNSNFYEPHRMKDKFADMREYNIFYLTLTGGEYSAFNKHELL